MWPLDLSNGHDFDSVRQKFFGLDSRPVCNIGESMYVECKNIDRQGQEVSRSFKCARNKVEGYKIIYSEKTSSDHTETRIKTLDYFVRDVCIIKYQ